MGACSDGNMYIFDLGKADKKPLVFKAHEGDVYSCEWNHIQKVTLAE